MKRALFAIVSTVASLVLLLSFKTHPQSATATPPAAVTSTGTTGASSGSGTADSSSSDAGSASRGGSSSSSGSSPATSTSSAAKTYTGTAAETRYGPVQVEITVKGGKVTGVSAVEYPSGSPRDAQINAYAIPALNREAVTAGSAHIDMISGATYTSQGYLSSLQSALDEAGL